MKAQASKTSKVQTTAAISAALVLIGVLIQPTATSDGIVKGLVSCVNIIIPSLFPFMTIAGFIALSGIAPIVAKPFSFVGRRLLRLPDELCAVVLMGFIGGYPVGAKTISTLLAQNRVTKQTASRMMCFCVNAGPSFLITAIGLRILGNQQIGVILLVSQLVSSLIIGCITARKATPEPVRTQSNTGIPLSEAFVLSVTNASQAMLGVCGFVVLFSAVIALLKATGIIAALSQVLSAIIPLSICTPDFFAAVISGLLEVTTGCMQAAALPTDCAFVLCTLFVSFSGISIICQAAACFSADPINLKPFFLSRIAHAILTLAIAYPLYKLIAPVSQTVLSHLDTPIPVLSAQTAVGGICMICMCTIVLLNTAKRRN